MSDTSKETVARNIKHYMNAKKVNSAEVCTALGFKQNTFSDWINAKTYPRIDKIELMADYFGILKSDLIEDKTRVSIKLSTIEQQLVLAFREADAIDRTSVLRTLGIDRKKSISELSNNVG